MTNDFQDDRPSPAPIDQSFKKGLVHHEVCIRNEHGQYIGTFYVVTRPAQVLKYEEPISAWLPDVFEKRIE
jgi:hypothetical protein